MNNFEILTIRIPKNAKDTLRCKAKNKFLSSSELARKILCKELIEAVDNEQP